jgi:hypothetical protein
MSRICPVFVPYMPRILKDTGHLRSNSGTTSSHLANCHIATSCKELDVSYLAIDVSITDRRFLKCLSGSDPKNPMFRCCESPIRTHMFGHSKYYGQED